MIFTLSIFINLCLIFAVWRISLRRYGIYREKVFIVDPKIKGLMESSLRKAAIAEKFAERAFSLASTANLGVVALQKTLQTRPRLVTKESSTRNELAKKEVDSLFGGTGNFDWLRPVLSDEENDLLDQVEAHNLKHGNGKVTN